MNDPRVRGIVYQLLTLLVVVWIGVEFWTNAVSNLERANIASGFGFLDTTAGFGIVQTLIEYTEESSYGRAFFVGLFNTLIVAFFGIILATVIGFLVGIGSLSRNWLIRQICVAYVEVMRNIPLLLHLFFWYFGVLRAVPGPRESLNFLDSVFVNNRGIYFPRPEGGDGFGLVLILVAIGIAASFFIARWARKRREQTGQPFPVLYWSLGLIVGLPLAVFLLLGMPLTFDYPALKGFNFRGGIVMIPEFISLVLALSIYTAGFIAENVRSGIQSVNKGQTEAAYALGIQPGPTMRLVIIPQAMRVIIPPLTSQYLNLTKNSSLAVAIAYPDLVSVFAGTVLNQTGQAVEILFLTMSVYLTLSIITSILMNWYNSRIALVER
ncbi:amino acid ABC transporter permease [Pyruvatibacter sp. HU-CL02332]|uniref:amino acid ABC transporter permease n=1 Tax=Pyruvatibacter sp. HU-CL02332 TaxID=3127650 RepID=UPI0031039E00